MATKHEKILRAAALTPNGKGGWGLPLLIWDEPGTAKTSMIEAMGSLYQCPVETLSPGERGEGAFGVTPVPNDDLSAMNYPPPSWANAFMGNKAGIVLVDELTGCPPALQPALLGLVLNKRIGGHYLGPRVRIFGAANPVECAAGGHDLAPPTANRFGHLSWDAPTSEEWIEWLMNSGVGGENAIDLEKEEARVLAAWPNAWAAARALVAGFIKARPGLLHNMPADDDANGSRAWPSRRTWEFATRALASAQVNGLTQVEADEFASAFVGNAAFAELVTYRHSADLPNPTDVLDGKVSFKHNPGRLDRTFAVLSACASLVAPTGAEKRKERMPVMLKMLLEVSENAIDICWPACKTLAKADAKIGKFNKDATELFDRILKPNRVAAKASKR